MALQECTLHLNQRLKELNPHGSLAFPCAGYSSAYTDHEENAIPGHWHEELEIIYIAEGRIELKIPSRSFYIEEGDAFVINSNILHYGIGADYCHLYSLVFSPALVCGKSRYLSENFWSRIVNTKSVYGYFFHTLCFHRTVVIIRRDACDFIYDIHAFCNFAKCCIRTV